ncbi:MAG: hypothetical protein FGM14_12320 [Flavobacteriales bacterium]|nr:hypothetical protein [Flavobacteriales bacterium]
MPRKKNEINQEALESLKKQVLEKSSIKLTRPTDCDELSNIIWQETKHLINPITFKRVYGFVNYPFNPSFQTLTILSQYLGYKDWIEYEQKFLNYKPISENELELYFSFFEFDSINQIEWHDGGIQSFSRKIAKRFREDPKTFKQNISKLASIPVAQKFFIEHFPDYDNLVEYYYLLFEEYLKNNNTIEGKLYGHCMLFLKALWTNNASLAKVIFGQIEPIVLPENVHPYLIGRYFSVKLYFHFFYGDRSQIPQIISDFSDRIENLPKDGKHFWDFPAAQYIFSEALLLTRNYQHCRNVVENAFLKYPIRNEFVRKGYYRQMQIFCLISDFKLGNQKLEEKLLSKINPENFYFISKRHFSIYFEYAQFLFKKNEIHLKNACKLCLQNQNQLLKLIIE